MSLIQIVRAFVQDHKPVEAVQQPHAQDDDEFDEFQGAAEEVIAHKQASLSHHVQPVKQETAYSDFDWNFLIVGEKKEERSTQPKLVPKPVEVPPPKKSPPVP